MSADSTAGRTDETVDPTGTDGSGAATPPPADGSERTGRTQHADDDTASAANGGDRVGRDGRTGPGGGADGADGAGDGSGEVDDVDDIEVRDPISAPDVDGVPRRATRRFPLFTRDTARPEGGGRAAPGDALAARQWPIILVLGIVALGLLVTALDVFRIGTILIGVGLLVGAVLRWLLPGVGMLAVRSRFTDIVTYTVLGAAIVLLALMVQPHPWLQIPFLKDTLHFTVSS
nr:DUF3017 domain-containing protein [Streptomyces sp. MBT49]